MNISVSILPHGQGLPLPSYATSQSAGCDLRAAIDKAVGLFPGQVVTIPCGFAMALPEGYEAQVRPRSGLAAKHGVTVLNAPGTIDADYRGELKVLLINHSDRLFTVHRGDRIAQMVIAPVVQVGFTPVASLQDTERGSGGFGSTGT